MNYVIYFKKIIYLLGNIFYPLISDMDLYKNMESARKENLHIARDISNKVLCLPIYADLDLDIVRFIARVIGNKKMKLAIMQPYLFPYLGYYQLMSSVDKFIIYDDVSYIKKWLDKQK